jgi:ABC-2 type transport system permease protein
MSPEPEFATLASPGRAFLAVLRRDVYVTWGELPIFLSQVILQPLFLLFVFGKVLGTLGYTTGNYADLLFPGLLALTAVITGMQTLAFPLVAEFGWTKEIEDRLLAPMPTALVAAEKVLFATGRALVATLVMVPIGIVVLGSIPWEWANVPLFAAVVVLGALLGASLGLVLGTLVPPNRINILFALVFTPLLFTGASQYPWPSLARLRWFQVLTALNPMTYVSEGLRAALVPDVPHIRPGICMLLLVASVAVLSAIGVRGFYRRALD